MTAAAAGKRGCTSLTRQGQLCNAQAVRDSGLCMGHQPKDVQRQKGFGGPQAGAGRPPAPRAVDVLRGRLEAQVDRVLAPFFDALDARMAMTVRKEDGSERVELLVDHNTRMRAASALLDRVYGRPRLTMDVSVEQRQLNVNVDLDAPGGREALATLLRQRPAVGE